MRHMKKPGYLQCKAWIAIVAFLLQALLPSLLYAAVPKDGGFTEICTSFGLKKISIGAIASPDSQDTQSGKTMSSHGHCPLCAAMSLDALPASAFLIDVVAVRIVASAHLVQSPPFATSFQAACPRGPPSFA